jgi:hypothetical protein
VGDISRRNSKPAAIALGFGPVGLKCPGNGGSSVVEQVGYRVSPVITMSTARLSQLEQTSRAFQSSSVISAR